MIFSQKLEKIIRDYLDKVVSASILNDDEYKDLISAIKQLVEKELMLEEEEIGRICEIVFAKYSLRWTSDDKKMEGISLSSQLAHAIAERQKRKLEQISNIVKKLIQAKPIKVK